MVLTPNTIHILVHLRAHLRHRMWGGSQGAEEGEVTGDKKAKVHSEFRMSHSKRSQLTEKTFEHLKHI